MSTRLFFSAHTEWTASGQCGEFDKKYIRFELQTTPLNTTRTKEVTYNDMLTYKVKDPVHCVIFSLSLTKGEICRRQSKSVVLDCLVTHGQFRASAAKDRLS